MGSIATVKTRPVFISADSRHPKEVLNVAGAALFHKTAPDVDSGDTELAVGSAVQITDGTYFVTLSSTEINVHELETVSAEDVTAVDDLTVGDDLKVAGLATVGETLAVTGVTTPSGGVAAPSALPGAYTGGWHPNTAESGTDATPAEKKLFTASLFLPVNKKIKGIGFLVGSVGGTNKVVAGLFSAAGKLLAHSSETTEGAVVGTAKEIQELNLTAEFDAVGPATYFIGITMNGNTARLRTIPKNTVGSNLLSKEITIAAKNVLADIAAPAALEADKGPVAWVF